MRVELRTGTAEETRAVGAAFAELLRPRDAVVLTGELGAGKTTLVQGIARGLTSTDHVASPTFTLVREYHGRLEIAHVDVYRLERIQDVVDLGLEDLGDGEAVLLVEWGDAVEEVLPADHVTIELTGGSDRRRAPDRGRRRAGRRWIDRWERLERLAGPVERRAVIVLGIDTSTPQTSVAIGTESEILAKRLDRRPVPAGVGHAGAAAVARVDRPRPAAGRRCRGRDRSGPVHGPPRGRRDRQDARAGAGRADRGHHEPRRPGVRRPVHVTADRGGDRRTSGRGLRRRLPGRARRRDAGDRLRGPEAGPSRRGAGGPARGGVVRGQRCHAVPP